MMPSFPSFRTSQSSSSSSSLSHFKDADDEENIAKSFRIMLDCLRQQRRNIFDFFNLERKAVCLNETYGCKHMSTTNDEFSQHMAECPYLAFTRCTIKGCNRKGRNYAFKNFDEFVAHHMQNHHETINIFNGCTTMTPTKIIVPEKSDCCNGYRELIKIIGVLNFWDAYVFSKVLILMRISRGGFQIFGITHDTDRSRASGLHKQYIPAHQLEMSMTLTLGHEDIVIEKEMSVYRCIQEYLKLQPQFQVNCQKLFVHPNKSLSLSAKIVRTIRFLMKSCIDDPSKSTIFDSRRMEKVTGTIKLVASAMTNNRRIVIESRESDELIIGTLLPTVSGPTKEKTGSVRFKKQLSKWHFSPKILILTDTTMSSKILRCTIIKCFPKLEVYCSFHLTMKKERVRIVRHCDVFITTGHRLHESIRQEGSLVLDAKLTKMVLIHRLDRQFSDRVKRNVENHIIPILCTKFSNSSIVGICPKLYPKLQRKIAPIFSNNTTAVLQIGPIGAMNLEHLSYMEIGTRTDDDLDKIACLKKKVFDSPKILNQMHRILIFVRDSGGLDRVSKLVKNYLCPTFKSRSCDYYREMMKGDDSFFKLKTFMEKDNVIFITTALVAAIKNIDTVILFRINEDFNEFMRQVQLATKRVIVLTPESNIKSCDKMYIQFKEEVRRLKNSQDH